MAAQFEFSLSSAGYLTLTRSFSVTSEKSPYHITTYCQKLDSMGYIYDTV